MGKKIINKTNQKQDLSPYSLTFLEKIIIRKLFKSFEAVNGFEIYKELLGSLLLYNSRETEDEQKKSFEAFFKESLDESYLHAVLHTKKDVLRAKEQLKGMGVNFPNYVKLIRIIDDLVDLKWIKKRTKGVGNAKALYYLDESIREKIRKNKKVFNC